MAGLKYLLFDKQRYSVDAFLYYYLLAGRNYVVFWADIDGSMRIEFTFLTIILFEKTYIILYNIVL